MSFYSVSCFAANSSSPVNEFSGDIGSSGSSGSSGKSGRGVRFSGEMEGVAAERADAGVRCHGGVTLRWK